MKLTVFFLLQCKRLCKNKLFVLLLLLFPMLLFLFSRAFYEEEDSRIRVGVCLATEDKLAGTVCEKLTTLDDSLFVFYNVPTEEELIKQVQNNTFECGYLFDKELEAELTRNRLKNLITVYVSDTTTCSGVLNELVYANLFEEFSLTLLQRNLKDSAHLPYTETQADAFGLPPVTEEQIEEIYRSRLGDGSTFRFDVQFVTNSATTELSGTTATVVPLLRGLVALFLLLCGFLGMLTVYHDRKNGLYARLYGFEPVLCSQLTMWVYLLPSALVSLLGLLLSDSVTSLVTELAALLCYLLALLLFYSVLGKLIRNHTVLCAAFPMLVLCTLVFTPVIADLSAFFPWIRLVRYALPTHYYLMFF